MQGIIELLATAGTSIGSSNIKHQALPLHGAQCWKRMGAVCAGARAGSGTL